VDRPKGEVVLVLDEDAFAGQDRLGMSLAGVDNVAITQSRASAGDAAEAASRTAKDMDRFMAVKRGRGFGGEGGLQDSLKPRRDSAGRRGNGILHGRMAEKTIPFAGLDRLPTLTTERLALRWITERDAPVLRRIFGDPEVVRYWSAPPLPDDAAALELVREIQALFKQRLLFQWGIARKGDDRLLGSATLWRWDRLHRRAEVGFALGRESWGQGYMAEALRTLFSYAFGELGLHRIEADADPRNQRSLAVLERLGFRREGYLRERFHVAGEIQDSLVLGLLRSEWDKRLLNPVPSHEAL